MNDRHDDAMSRRTALRLLAGAVGAAAGFSLPGWAAASPPDASAVPGTVAKSAVRYQDHPNGASSCTNCANFNPPRKPGMPGHCIIVAGDISPTGWCLAYAGKG